MAIVLMFALLRFFQEYRAEKAMAALKKARRYSRLFRIHRLVGGEQITPLEESLAAYENLRGRKYPARDRYGVENLGHGIIRAGAVRR
ncbi:MAG: hypothetical protein M3458_06685 [Acidobacteriota bacterium]|nr:hypothetical protein [Acidobacteriota bacterium]